MKKKVLSLILALALGLGLAVPALAAGKLSTPTDLAWGGEGNSPDTMSWRFGENTKGIAHIVVYRNGQMLTEMWLDSGMTQGNSRCTYSLREVLAGDNISGDSIPMGSGTYHFTVQNATDIFSTSSDNSAAATSPKWTYTAPTAKLTAPSDPVWDFPYCKWQSQVDTTKSKVTSVQFCFSKAQNGNYEIAGGDTVSSTVKKASINTFALEYGGVGYYKFRVSHLSDDVTRVQSSDWSAYSEPYYYDGREVNICQHRNWDLRNWKEATCTEPGYTGDSFCTDCGEIMEYGEAIPATGHNIGSDGWCYYCGKQIEYHGTLGDSSELSWVYSTETGELAFSGVIPSGETVFVARYQNGRLAGVKTATGSSPTVNVGTAFEELRLFWLDGSQVPQCRAGSLSLEP